MPLNQQRPGKQNHGLDDIATIPTKQHVSNVVIAANKKRDFPSSNVVAVATNQAESNNDNDKRTDEKRCAFTKIFTKSTQYTKDAIQMFEYAFGKNHMSAGGHSIIFSHMTPFIGPLAKTSSVLDLGFGVGGTAFCLAHEFDCNVLGIDINQTGYEIACTELEKEKNKSLPIQFKLQDITTASFDAESFDVIYSRDTLLHLNGIQKQKLFEKCYNWLKPGGKFWIGDYGLGWNHVHLDRSQQDTTATSDNNNHDDDVVMEEDDVASSETFRKYLQARGYHLWTAQDYASHVERAGFEDVVGRDMSDWYCNTCQQEINNIHPESFLQTHTQSQLQNIYKTYQDKIKMTREGNRTYVMVCATKTTKSSNKRQKSYYE